MNKKIENPFESPHGSDGVTEAARWNGITSPEMVLPLTRLGWKASILGAVFFLAAIISEPYTGKYPGLKLATLSLLGLTLICILTGVLFSLYGSLWYSQVPQAMRYTLIGIAANFTLGLLVCSGIVVAILSASV